MAGPVAVLYRRLDALSRPRIRRAVFALALLLVSPSLFSGFAADDYILEYELRGPHDAEWAGTPPWDLYRLFDPAHVKRLVDGAGLPWWTFLGAKCSFLRPVSGLTHLLDEWLAQGSAVVAHVQSVLWFALLLALALHAYRRTISSPWITHLAFALFALDFAHGTTVGWIVNRSALVGAALGVLAWLCHERQRRAGGLGYALAAPLCLGLGMFATELTLGVMGYFLAYALFLDRASLRSRALSLVPSLVVLALWALARHAGGHGTYGLYAYIDPARDPLAFAAGLPARVTLLLASQTLHLNADVFEMLPLAVQPGFIVLGVACCALVLWFAWPSLRAHASARFWAVGTLLCAVPMGATQPSDRLLTLVGFGAMPVLAYAIHDALQTGTRFGAGASVGSTPRAKCANLVSLVHLILSPLLLPVMTLSVAALDHHIAKAEASLPMDRAFAEQSAIVLSVPDSAFMSYQQVMRWAKHHPRPQQLYWLVSTQASVHIERRAENVLRVRPERGFFDHRSEARSPLHPLARGERVELSELTVHVIELTQDGRPAVCDFEFRRSLSDPHYAWFTWRDGVFVPARPPGVGESRTLPALVL